MRLIDETGNRYGTLLVLSRASNSCTDQTRWKCRCDCGRITVVHGSHLRNGESRSCFKGHRIVTPIPERFWKRVVRGKGCWEWSGAKDGKGYGHMWDGRGVYPSHRISWAIHYGKIPPGLEVCHRCDNPGCVRPDHLFLGTHRENHRDSAVKGRRRRKLTPQQVRAIRADLRTGVMQRDVASKFGVGQSCISSIVRGGTWTHVVDGHSDPTD